MKKIRCKYYDAKEDKCLATGEVCETNPDRASKCESNTENELIIDEYGLEREW